MMKDDNSNLWYKSGYSDALMFVLGKIHYIQNDLGSRADLMHAISLLVTEIHKTHNNLVKFNDEIERGKDNDS